MPAVFTIVSLNYLPFARVLMNSLAEQHPDWQRYVILADKPQQLQEPYQILPSCDLEIPSSSWFHFRYNILELNTAIKPYAFSHLLSRHDKVVYFDPDILITGSLEPLCAALDSADILLTPHLLEPLPNDGLLPDDLTILKAGAYNLGFLAARACDDTRRFTAWWQDRLERHAYVDFEKGLFTDQRWIDLVPALFPNTQILRDPSYNVAYWNLHERRLDTAQPRFFHFSGFDPHHPENLSKFQTRFAPEDLGPARPLLDRYAQLLLAAGYDDFRPIPYAYADFQNGEPILDICRRYAEDVPGLEARIPDAFSPAAYAEYLRYWNEPVWTPANRENPLTRYALLVHRTRPQIARQLPNPFGNDHLPYLDWLANHAQIPEPFLAPIRQLLSDATTLTAAERRKAQLTRYQAENIPHKLQGLLNSLSPLDHPPEILPWLAGPVSLATAPAPRIAALILQSRADLQQTFASNTPGLLRWLITSGAVEYDLPRVLIASAKRMLRDFERKHRTLPQRLTSNVTDELRMALNRVRAPKAPELARRFRISGKPVHANPVPHAPPLSAGLNVIGYVRSEHGIGEAARALIRAAQSAGIPVSTNDYETNNPSRQHDNTFTPDNRFAHDVNVCVVNADQTSALRATLPPQIFEGRYNIGYWVWELETFPETFTEAFRHYDEIWVPSTFALDSIARRSPVPVIRIPHAIDIPEQDPRPANPEFTFLTAFDALSVVERKNPQGVLEAFRRALPELGPSRLIIKVNNGHHHSAFVDDLRRQSAALAVTILDQVITRREMNTLVNSCDCLVSLHRSEGFGLLLAEAMYLGKPVIATAYSGNMDFTRPDAAFLIPFDYTTVTAQAAPYPAGARWAEPDIDEAARALITVRHDAALRADRSARGRTWIRQEFSPEAIGKLVAARLEHIRSTRRCD